MPYYVTVGVELVAGEPPYDFEVRICYSSTWEDIKSQRVKISSPKIRYCAQLSLEIPGDTQLMYKIINWNDKPAVFKSGWVYPDRPEDLGPERGIAGLGSYYFYTNTPYANTFPTSSYKGYKCSSIEGEKQNTLK
ncbi:MAG: hypothetical protein QXH17_04365 [Candidatus Bathyarchaeia archaeon]|nr:hypothetical protein [Candidatus Bathyarchaeota archaeon]